MVVSSTIFVFLPVVLALYFLVRPRLRNGLLLQSSLGYCAWGESPFLQLVLLSVFANYLFGLALQELSRALPRTVVLALAVALNLGLLLRFKYATFAVNSYNSRSYIRATLHWP